MHVLILSANTGGGHNSCAGAIKDVFDEQSIPCVMVDVLSFVSEKASDFISRWHTRIYRYAPELFRTGYRFSENHPDVFQENSRVFDFLTLGSERLGNYIKVHGFDTVVCVHVFSSLILTETMKKQRLDIRSCFVATDYTCSPGVEDSNVDIYFIPDKSLTEDFTVGSITADQIVASGIPVREMFFKRTDKPVAKRSVGVNENSRHLLIMCGSMGCGPVWRITDILSYMLPEGCEATVVCGTNERLYERLAARYAGEKRIHVCGYVSDMSLLMDSADLYLTKPGGLSTSEAAVKRLPMVLIDAVAGCEEYNRDFFVRRGGAETADTVEELAEMCCRLLEDEKALKKMADSLARVMPENPARKICACLETPGEPLKDIETERQTWKNRSSITENFA